MFMRMVYKKYADDTYKVYETDDEGDNVRVVDGNVPDDNQVRRVPVFVEVSCDDKYVGDAMIGLVELTKILKSRGKKRAKPRNNGSGKKPVRRKSVKR